MMFVLVLHNMILVIPLILAAFCINLGHAKSRLSRATLHNVTETFGLPSVAYGITDGSQVHHGVYGVRQWGSDIMVTADDRYHLGSDSKAFTALLVGILVEQGDLGWNTTLGELFPDWNLSYNISSITVQELLSHSSGLPSDNSAIAALLWDSQSYQGNMNDIRSRVVQSGLLSLELVSPRGTEFHYSNFGFLTVGVIVEKLFNSTWEQLVQEHIFRAFAFETAGFWCQASFGVIDAPLPHLIQDDRVQYILAGPNCDNPMILGPAGTIHMSIKEFSRWAAWNAANGTIGPHIVGGDIVRYLHEPVIEMKLENPPVGTPPSGWYAKGWGLVDVPWMNKTILYHGGSNGMNLAQVYIDSPANWSMVLMTNIGEQRADDALRTLFQLATQ